MVSVWKCIESLHIFIKSTTGAICFGGNKSIKWRCKWYWLFHLTQWIVQWHRLPDSEQQSKVKFWEESQIFGFVSLTHKICAQCILIDSLIKSVLYVCHPFKVGRCGGAILWSIPLAHNYCIYGQFILKRQKLTVTVSYIGWTVPPGPQLHFQVWKESKKVKASFDQTFYWNSELHN